MAASNPWDSTSEPNAAGLLLSHFLASEMVTEVRGGDRSVIKGLPVVATKDGCEVVVPMRVMLGAQEKQQSDRFAEMLNISKKPASCFVNFSRRQQIINIQTEISQKNLEIELLKLEKDTAEFVNPSLLAKKCHDLQSMNNHLEAMLKEKRSLRERLLKPTCQENLPIEAVYHRYMVQLLELAVSFIERLEAHLETIRDTYPHLDANLRKMSKALEKMDILVTKTEELAENILKWREEQKEVTSYIPKIVSEETFLQGVGW